MEAFLIQLAVNLVVSYYVWLLTAPDGPRLQGRDATQGDYGATLSLTFGEECPVGGKVIWLGPRIETKHDQKGLLPDWATGLAGSLIPKPKYYTYSRSFAVHVSDRLHTDPIEDIPKVWFNGRVVLDHAAASAPTISMTEAFNTDGSLKWRKWTDTGGGLWSTFTIYGGGFEQDPDPIIASNVANAQAYRGSAYYVVEDLQITTGGFGDILPQQMRHLVQSKTGETVADVANAIARAAGIDPTTEMSTTAAAGSVVRGFAIEEEVKCWDALAPLLPAYGLDIAEVAGSLRVYRRTGIPRATIPASDMAAHEAGEERPETWIAEDAPDMGLPRELTLTTIDPDRDYQPNTYTSRRSEGEAQSNVSRSIAIVQTADERAKLAETLHWEAWLGRRTASISVTDRWNPTPGVCYAVEAGESLWVARVTRRTRGANGVTEVELKSDERVLYSPTATGTIGDFTPPPMDVYGGTTIVPLDGPIVADADDDAGFYFAMAGEEATWTRGHVQFSRDGTAWSDVLDSDGDTIAAAVDGVLPDGPWETDDDTTVITITLPYDTLSLDDATDTELDGDANLCAIGDPDAGFWEYLQFGTAVRVSDGVWELSHLRRGRRGTDWATALHGAGETFILISQSGVYRLNPGMAYWNIPLYLRSWSATQTVDQAVTVTLENTGEGKRPYSPVDPMQSWAGGDLTISWTRRSRFSDGSIGTDAPESYEVDILDGLTVVRTLASSTPSVLYSAADMATDGVSATHVEGNIYQLNPDRGRGHPRHFLFATTAGAGLAAGSAGVSGAGAATAEGAGSSSGTSTASADTSGSGAGTAGAAAGTSTVSGVGGATVAGAGTSSGTATVSGEGSTGVTGHRYWRVYVDANGGDGSLTTIGEVELHTSVGGADVTGSGTAISGGSGTDGVGNEATKAFDNTGTTEWARSASTDTWVGYDFGAGNEKNIVEFSLAIYSTGSSATDYARMPKTFRLQYSDDNVSWTDSMAGLTAYGWLAAQTRTYPETVPAAGYHKFWRVFCSNNNGGTSLITIRELEFRATHGGADQAATLTNGSSDPAGRCVASSAAVGNDAYKAFDGTTSPWAGNGTTNQYVGYIFPTTAILTEVAITADSSTTRAPKDVSIDWSDDGVTWTSVATASLTAWTAGATKLVSW